MNTAPISAFQADILVVDDAPNNLRLLSELLTEQGYQVRKAINGKMALQTLQITLPDLILLDINMPEMNGYQVCQHLKANERTVDIPVIFISALGEVWDKVKAFGVGGVDYITKPFQEEEVLARIHGQLMIQKQKVLLNGVLNSSLDGIAVLEAVRDLEGEITGFSGLLINPIITNFLGMSQEDLLYKFLPKTFFNQLDKNLFESFTQVLKTGHHLQKDIHYRNNKGGYWYHLIAVKLKDGLSITLQDITSRKKLELELFQANQKLHRLAHIDGLTQVANRRCFDETLSRVWQECQQQKQPLGLILADVDYFKNYNDYYGHQQGDQCLIQVAQVLDKIGQNPQNLVARYGGEEFAVILVNCDGEKAKGVAELIRDAMKKLNLSHEESQVSHRVTLSLGVTSVVPTPEKLPEDLIAQADRALYKAKAAGRDRALFSLLN